MNKINTPKTELGNRVKLIRQYFSLKQREMAENLGLKQGSYSRIELGSVGMSLSVLRILIEKYNVDINWLLTGKGKMFVSKFPINSDLEKEYLEVVKENSNLKTRIIILLDNKYSKEPVLSH